MGGDGLDHRFLFLLANLAVVLFAEKRELRSSGHDSERRVGVKHPGYGHFRVAAGGGVHLRDEPQRKHTQGTKK